MRVGATGNIKYNPGKLADEESIILVLVKINLLYICKLRDFKSQNWIIIICENYRFEYEEKSKDINFSSRLCQKISLKNNNELFFSRIKLDERFENILVFREK